MTNIFQNLSKWTEGSGPHADIVISTRVRLARNLASYPFPHHLTSEQELQILNDAKEAIEADNFIGQFGATNFLDLGELNSLQKWALVEKHLISPQQAQDDKHRAAIVSKDEDISIMLIEEDHLRIQCLLPALQIQESYRRANEIDDALEQKLDFAFNKEKGYLTVCPTNVGTGLRASVMLHLPALVMSKQAGRVLSALSQVGLAVRGTYGEGTETFGNLFQISNQRTLGKSEEDILSNLSSVTQHIIEQEKQARSLIQKEIPDQLEDRVWRAYGVLSNARSISSKEAMNLLSELRMGIDLKIISEIDARIFNELLVLIQPAFLQMQKNHELTPQMRDKARAEIIRNKVKNVGK